MQRIRDVFVQNKSLVSITARIIAIAAVAMFGFINATPTPAQLEAQNPISTTPVYKYEVVSVKASKPGTSGGYTMNTPDGYTAKGTLLMILIQSAYGIMNNDLLSGAPGWISSERFDVEAKMESSVAEALQKMSKDDRILARQRMLQALLADRFNLTVRRETRELSIYTLVIAKNGPKLKEAKPDDNSPDRIKGVDGHPVTNMVSNRLSVGGGVTMTGQAVSMTYLILHLSQQVGRIIVDKTGLVGNYDFTIQFTPEQGGMQLAPNDAPGSASSLPPSEPGAPSIFTAVQEQLGLKLESGKGPVEIIVIDHVERPSGN